MAPASLIAGQFGDSVAGRAWPAVGEQVGVVVAPVIRRLGVDLAVKCAEFTGVGRGFLARREG
jgi:hypothetical protein